jgi:predicted outer membrane lipoprotein
MSRVIEFLILVVCLAIACGVIVGALWLEKQNNKKDKK